MDFKDILFIEALKDYVIIQTVKQRLITHLNLKAIHEMLPQTIFLKSNRSYITKIIVLVVILYEHVVKLLLVNIRELPIWSIVVNTTKQDKNHCYVY